MTITRPVRLQLSRRKGFNLQALSFAINGLDAVSVARPGRYGNLFKVGLATCGCRSAGECGHNAFNCETAAEAVEQFRSIPRSERRLEEIRRDLAGRNLACWCNLGEPCHADVLLELANAPICEAIP
ncbi:MAG: DUF4326 domain-containing protein [Roseiarcus sp.]|jgi:hypothetical protein